MFLDYVYKKFIKREPSIWSRTKDDQLNNCCYLFPQFQPMSTHLAEDNWIKLIQQTKDNFNTGKSFNLLSWSLANTKIEPPLLSMQTTPQLEPHWGPALLKGLNDGFGERRGAEEAGGGAAEGERGGGEAGEGGEGEDEAAGAKKLRTKTARSVTPAFALHL